MTTLLLHLLVATASCWGIEWDPPIQDIDDQCVETTPLRYDVEFCFLPGEVGCAENWRGDVTKKNIYHLDPSIVPPGRDSIMWRVRARYAGVPAYSWDLPGTIVECGGEVVWLRCPGEIARSMCIYGTHPGPGDPALFPCP